MICELEVVAAEDLGLDVQALAKIARADADGVPLLHHAKHLDGVLGVEPDLGRHLVDRDVGGSLPFSRSTPLRSRKPFSSRLPRTSSAKRCSVSVKSLICSCQRR